MWVTSARDTHTKEKQSARRVYECEYIVAAAYIYKQERVRIERAAWCMCKNCFVLDVYR